MNTPTPAPKPARSLWARLGNKASAAAIVAALGLAVAGASVAPNIQLAFADTQAQTVQTPHGAAPLTFADIVEKVRPAVVSISVKNGVKMSQGPGPQGGPGGPGGPGFEFRGLPDLPDDHPLNELFKRFREGAPQGRSAPSRPTQAQGSGFIISADGFVVTNQHVIDDADEIRITMDDGEKLDAEVIGIDQRTDLALLKIKAKDKTFKFVEFADKTARVGDWVVAVGNPFGLGGTVTAGIVSAHNRDIGSSPYDYLQIDAAVNRGNSGGPTFNLDGKVVGVNTAIFSPSGGNVGIAFAVPAQLAKQVTAQLRDSGTVARGWLGVSIQQVTEDIASSMGLKDAHGALITALTDDGPAVKSKLKPGDIVLKVNEDKIEDSRDLARKIAAIPPGTKVQVLVSRDGDEMTIPVELGTFPGAKQLAELRQGNTPVPEKKSEAEAVGDIGLTLAPAASVTGSGKEGVVITEVDPASEAAGKGLKAGDIILEVAGQSVSRPGDVTQGVQRAKDKGRGAVLMRVKSGEQQRFVALPLKKA